LIWPMPSGRPDRAECAQAPGIAILITAQDQGLLRRIEIEADDIPECLSKCLSLDNLKVRDRYGLMSLAAHRC
jgi:hypothetical protein